jgi:hypothetical protein
MRKINEQIPTKNGGRKFNWDLLVSICAIILSIGTFSYSVKQNKNDSEHSDSIFKTQKAILDSQLVTTKNQLVITQDQLTELKILSKPRLFLNNIFIGPSSSNRGIISNFSIQFDIKNTGNREAHNLTYEAYMIQNKFVKCLYSINGSIINSLNAEEAYNFYNEKDVVKNKKLLLNDFERHYNYLLINYRDEVLNKNEFLEIFCSEASESFENSFTQEERNKIRSLVKKYKTN